MAIAQAQKKVVVQPDRVVNGVRHFNPTKPHGTVYADGFYEAKHVQEYEGKEVYYRGDGTPIGGTPEDPTPETDLARENADLRRRVAELEAGKREAKAPEAPADAGAKRK